MTVGDTQQDQNASTDATQEPQEGAVEATEEQVSTDTPEATTDAVEEPQGDEDGADDGDHDELPEWGRKQLTKARNEAANYRRKLAEANENLSKATSPEEFKAVQDALAAAHLELETERIANRYHLPAEMRQVLAGKTKEEVEAHAKILAQFVPSPGVDVDDLSGGLNPQDNEDGDMDPRALAAKIRRR